MTELNYRDIIGEAISREYMDVPDPDELGYEYCFTAF